MTHSALFKAAAATTFAMGASGCMGGYGPISSTLNIAGGSALLNPIASQFCQRANNPTIGVYGNSPIGTVDGSATTQRNKPFKCNGLTNFDIKHSSSSNSYSRENGWYRSSGKVSEWTDPIVRTEAEKCQDLGGANFAIRGQYAFCQLNR